MTVANDHMILNKQWLTSGNMVGGQATLADLLVLVKPWFDGQT
jgi:hypothetical protein